MGEPQQLLAGTLSDGDRVDVVATARYTSATHPGDDACRPAGPARARGARRREGGGSAAATKASRDLVMNDSQAQTMGWAMKKSTWFLVLRPTKRPRNSKPSLETLQTILGRGLNPSKAAAQDRRHLPGERR